MKHTLLLVSHNRPIQDATRHSVTACMSAGAQLIVQAGVTDVTLARNLALSSAVRRLEKALADLERSIPDVVLMVDDDMVFALDVAEQLVSHARATGVAASAMYGTTMGTLAATRLKTESGDQRWATGLGLLAIPAQLLFLLRAQSEVFTFNDLQHWGFTWSLATGGNYWSEDFALCRRLGGVHLLPVVAGHLKTVPIYPDDETIACVREGRPLAGELTNVLEHVQDGDMLAATRFLASQPDAAGNPGKEVDLGHA